MTSSAAISPPRTIHAHDSYVTAKGDGAEKYPAPVRMAILEKALKVSDWLETDPWMANAPGDVNFTDVFSRLENYLRTHLPSDPPIEVAYVFGADNARFARAFLAKGMGVCVSRPGFGDKVKDIKNDAALMRSGRIFFAGANADISSRKIRKNAQKRKRPSPKGFKGS